MNQLFNIQHWKGTILSLLLFSLFQIAVFGQEVVSDQRTVDVRKIYYQTLEVNTSLKNGNNTEVIIKANAIIDSFPRLICQTPYFSYLNYYKGSAYRSLGNYYLSKKCYAIAGYCFHIDKNSVLYVNSRSNLAITLFHTKNYDEARSILEDLISNYESTMNHDNLANIYSNLAALGIRMNDSLLCRTSFERVLALMEEPSGGEFAPFIAYRNYGRYLLSQGRLSEGREYLNRSLGEAIDSLGQTHFQIGISCNHLGELYAKTEKKDSASYYYKKAIDILSQSAIDNSKVELKPQYETVLIECFLNYGDLLLNGLTDYQGAFDMFQRAVNRLQYLSHAINAEATRFIIAEKGREAFNKGVISAIELYKLTGDKMYNDLAFEWTLQAKSLSLNWLTEKDLIYRKAGIPKELSENLKKLRKAMDLRMTDNTDGSQALALDSISQLLRLYENAEEQIRANYCDILREKANISLETMLAESLWEGEKYLGFFDTDSVLLAFIVSRKGKEIIPIEKDSLLQSSIEHFKKTLSKTPNANYSREDVERFSSLSNYLYERLIKPIIIKSDRSLAIHPDGVLLGFSFEALVEQHKSQITFKKLPYLLKSHEIRYVATPFFSKPLKRKFNKKSKIGIISCGTSERASMIETEVESLYDRFPNSSLYYIDKEAFQFDKLVHEQEAIHISSHLSINQQDVFSSGLSCMQSDSFKLLTFRDILYQDIPGKPVFINGCESGSGPLNRGEGLMSLGLAFTMAGSKSIIQHFWEASDQSSSEIASNYYTFFLRNPESVALRKAKRKYLRGSRIGYDHPYYWAGMVFYGSRENEAPSSFVIIIITIAVIICAIVILRKRFYS